MNRILISIMVIIIAVASGVLLFKIISGEEDSAEVVNVDVPQATPVREQATKRPIRNIVGNTPRSRNTPVAVELPEDTPTPETDEYDPFKVLFDKTNQWVYRGFIQIGDERYGLMENFRTSDEWQVREGEVYNDVLVDSLAFEVCILRLESATRSLNLSPKLDLDINEIFQGPPSEDVVAERVRHYDEHIRPTFEHLASKYTPGPHETMPVPLSKEEVERNVANYEKNIAPTFQYRSRNYTPHAGEIMPQKPKSNQDSERLQKAYIATYHPEHLATAFPDWQTYFEQQQEYEEQLKARQGNQGQPMPSPNQSPYSE